ncbi:hypothetical protein MHU86_14776 [Fragilaria crotonensis]|nr:hypothetical protein MHU86_14776 [Fragilaria crotonensis]
MSPFPSSPEQSDKRYDKVEAPEPPQRLYYPSVFKYNCYGVFYADTWNNNNNSARNGDSRLPSGGICYGIKSNLSQVRDWHHPSTEEQSLDLWLRDLEDPAQYLLDGRPVVQQSSSSYSPSTTMSTTRTVPDNRMNTSVKNTSAGPTNGASRISNKQHDSDGIFATLPILVYPTAVDAAAAATEHDKNATADDNDNTNTHAYRHKWTGRGKTKVLVLVGQPQISNMDSSTDDSNQHIGPHDDYDEGDDRSITHQQLLQQGIIMAAIPRLEYGTSSHTVDLPPTKCQVNRALIVGPVELVLQTIMPPAPEPGTLPDDSTMKQKQLHNFLQDLNLGTLAMQGGQRVYDQSGKIITSMQRNAGILRDAVKDDFPNRCLAASGRITNQFGATLNSTVTLMQDVYRYWTDDDDDDDHHHGD